MGGVNPYIQQPIGGCMDDSFSINVNFTRSSKGELDNSFSTLRNRGFIQYTAETVNKRTKKFEITEDGSEYLKSLVRSDDDE